MTPFVVCFCRDLRLKVAWLTTGCRVCRCHLRDAAFQARAQDTVALEISGACPLDTTSGAPANVRSMRAAAARRWIALRGEMFYRRWFDEWSSKLRQKSTAVGCVEATRRLLLRLFNAPCCPVCSLLVDGEKEDAVSLRATDWAQRTDERLERRQQTLEQRWQEDRKEVSLV